MVAVQKIDNVRENRRCNIVKQRAQALCLVFCKVPDDRGRAEAVEVPGIGCFFHVEGTRCIFTSAVHADIQQPPHGRRFRERQKLCRKTAIARDDLHRIPSFSFILPESARSCNKACKKIPPHRFGAAEFCIVRYRMTSSPFSTSTVIVSPGRMLPARIFFAMSVSTVCWIYRRRGRAPNCGS